jgi:transposase
MKYLKNIEKFVENKTVFCGMDIHKEHWNLCFFSDGMVIEKLQMPAQFNRLVDHTRRYYQDASSVRFVYEAGFSGFHLYRQLTAAGYCCMITPPNRVPSLSDKVKTDKRDALKLAQMVAAGLLKEVFVPPLSVESDRQVLRLRNNNQKKLSRVKIQINSHLSLNGQFWSKDMGNHWTKKYIAWLQGLEFQEPYLRFILDQYLTEYHFYRKQIADLTRHIREISRKEAYQVHFKCLTASKGIGLITAMTFLLELWDLSRFSSTGKFSSYLGLTPSQHSSGQHVRLGHITREGNAHVRRVLVESAWTVIRHDPFLKEKYDRIRAKGTNGKKAIVAVARSLGLRLRRCLLDGTPYQVGIC